MTMTKKEAIKKYLNDMTDVDLLDLVRSINSWSDEYEPWTFYSMDELDEVFCNTSPTEIIDKVQDACSDFSTCDDYFYFDECGVLQSCTTAEAADLIRTDILDDLTNGFLKGRYLDSIYNMDFMYIVKAPGDALFDDKYYVIDEQE